MSLRPLQDVPGLPREMNPFEGIIPATPPFMPMQLGVDAAPRVGKPSTFGKGGSGWNVVGAIADAVNSAYGQGTPYANAVKGQRDEHRSILAEQLALAKIAQEGRPKPAEPTTTQRTYEYLKSLNPGLAETYINNQAQGAPVAVDSVDAAGNTVRQYMRPGQLGQQPAAPAYPSAPVGKLRPLGGAPSAGGATFR